MTARIVKWWKELLCDDGEIKTTVSDTVGSPLVGEAAKGVAIEYIVGRRMGHQDETIRSRKI
jgi:hypothetical protein